MQGESTQSFWTFGSGAQEEINIAIRISIAFQQRGDRSHKYLKKSNDTFSRPPRTSAQCLFGTEKHPDSAILLICGNIDYSQGYGQIKEASKALAKGDILNQILSNHDLGPLMLMLLVKLQLILGIIYTFPINDNRETYNRLYQLRKSLKFQKICLLGYMVML